MRKRRIYDAKAMAMIQSIKAKRGSFFAIGVSNFYCQFRQIKGFDRYWAMFCAVETQLATISPDGITQSKLESQTQEILTSAGILESTRCFASSRAEEVAADDGGNIIQFRP